MPPLTLWVEAAVAAVFTILFVIYAMVAFKPEHVEHHPMRVYIGAGLQGLIIGLMFGFVILPLRMAFMAAGIPSASSGPPGSIASMSFLPAFILLLVIRRGLLARAPIVGPYLRAYRRAALKQQIDGARRALTRLEALDTRKAET